ncbi:hypothetical protein MKX03_008253 [Papaver bracteatum]|nr:hypothetical protein MKX03_008253 [Papaver bracteatum]
MLNAEQPFRLNWASFSMGDKRSDAGSDKSIFVGDLTSDVTDTVLHETFASRYASVKGAKVIIDANTGRLKGYRFVRFGDDSEMSRAMTEMNGVYCSSRGMRIGPTTPRKLAAYQQQQSSQGGYPSNSASAHDGDSTNTTIFVGGLDSIITDDDLKQTSQYGEITTVKIPLGKGCGFVKFANRNNAEEHRRVKVKKKEKSKLAREWWREANSTGGCQEDEIIGAEMKDTFLYLDLYDLVHVFAVPVYDSFFAGAIFTLATVDNPDFLIL